MASDFHFYNHVFTQLSTSLSTYVSDTSATVVIGIAPFVYSLLMIYVILWGWAMISGKIQEAVLDGFQRIIRLTLIAALAINLGTYNTAIGTFLWQTPDALANLVTSGYGDGTGTVTYLDTLMSQMYDLGDAFWQKSHMSPGILPDMGLLGVAIMVWIMGVISTAYAAFLLALAKMSIAILLGVGPIFIIGLFFEPTKRFFDAWLGQVCNFIFLVLLSAAAVQLILSILKSYLIDADAAGVYADPSISQALPALAISVIAFLILMQLPSIASALGGGVAVSTLGSVGWMYGKSTGTMAAMRPTALRRAGLRAKSDLRIAKGAVVAGVKAPYTMPRAVYRKITGGTKNRVSAG